MSVRVFYLANGCQLHAEEALEADPAHTGSGSGPDKCTVELF